MTFEEGKVYTLKELSDIARYQHELMRSYIDAHVAADREWTDEIQKLWEEMAKMVRPIILEEGEE